MNPRSTALHEADKYFSLWFRANESDEFGFVKCSTCQNILEWKASDGSTQFGHWKPRTHNKTRFNPKNGGVQCMYCNCFKDGREKEMKDFLIRRHGIEAVEEIENTFKHVCHLSRLDLEEIAEEYKGKFEELVAQKRL